MWRSSPQCHRTPGAQAGPPGESGRYPGPLPGLGAQAQWVPVQVLWEEDDYYLVAQADKVDEEGNQTDLSQFEKASRPPGRRHRYRPGRRYVRWKGRCGLIMEQTLTQRIQTVQQKIAEAARQAGRDRRRSPSAPPPRCRPATPFVPPSPQASPSAGKTGSRSSPDTWPTGPMRGPGPLHRPPAAQQGEVCGGQGGPDPVRWTGRSCWGSSTGGRKKTWHCPGHFDRGQYRR